MYKDIIFDEVVENNLKKYFYKFPFKYTAIVNDVVISNCNLISYKDKEYLIKDKPLKNWYQIEINIHGIRRTYYLKEVQYIEEIDHIDYYTEVV
jgi:hypothetical protein